MYLLSPALIQDAILPQLLCVAVLSRADDQTVKQNQQEYGLPLKILSYNDLYGWTMDRIVDQIGKKNNCKLHRYCTHGTTRGSADRKAPSAVYSDDKHWIEGQPSWA